MAEYKLISLKSHEDCRQDLTRSFHEILLHPSPSLIMYPNFLKLNQLLDVIVDKSFPLDKSKLKLRLDVGSRPK